MNGMRRDDYYANKLTLLLHCGNLLWQSSVTLLAPAFKVVEFDHFKAQD